MSWEPRVIGGHPALVLEPDDSLTTPEPHWRPWGIRWKYPKSEPTVIHLCANCERMRTVLFLSHDRWLCTACRNEGTARPTVVPIGRAHHRA